MRVKRMTDLDLMGKRVLIRADLNVPMKNGRVTSDARLRASLPTIEQTLKAGAKVMVMSHLGRPTEGAYDPRLSLQPVADALSQLLECKVQLAREWLDGVQINGGELVLCENVRFNSGEGADDPNLAKKMAALCDIFVMDAFGAAHRAQASTHGVARFAPIACAGPLLVAELDALSKALENPARPVIAIVGGSKVSTKLSVLEALATKIDQLIVGGGIANTFIAAAGYKVGNSLYEPSLVEIAGRLSAAASNRNVDIPLPADVVCAKEHSEDAIAEVKPVARVAADDMIMDIGPRTHEQLAKLLKRAGTIIWNGPMGVFEMPQFANGTKALALAIADAQAFSVAGGGDTLAAIDQFDLADKISYISTGGGAFLEFLEGKTLPAIEILQARAMDCKHF